ncbi:DRMBL-domain-containing protein [Lactarius pseudohatsudake]|nr:DRMBL-domain-containing protein [Lactarius pseudohatsudake]
MSSRKANEAWKEAETVGDRSFRPTKAKGGEEQRRFTKAYPLPSMLSVMVRSLACTFRVFRRVGKQVRFTAPESSEGSLVNLESNSFTEGTASLMLSVDPKWDHPMVPNSGGVTVTLIEANHCPGSSLIFVEGSQTVNAGDSTYKYLHCGDFRASPRHTLHPAYLFLAQAQVIPACAELSRRLVSGQGLAEDDKGTVSRWLALIPKIEAKGEVKLANALIFVGTYSIGKERIVKAIAKALDSKIYCDRRKAATIRCQSDPELHEMLATDTFSANVHIEYMGRWNGHWTKAVAFRPTGWTSTPSVASTFGRPLHREFTHTHLRPARGSTPSAQLFGVPYSEYSSFFELTYFALSLDWARIVPTVNVESAASRAERRKRPLGVVPPYRTPEYW